MLSDLTQALCKNMARGPTEEAGYGQIAYSNKRLKSYDFTAPITLFTQTVILHAQVPISVSRCPSRNLSEKTVTEHTLLYYSLALTMCFVLCRSCSLTSRSSAEVFSSPGCASSSDLIPHSCIATSSSSFKTAQC